VHFAGATVNDTPRSTAWPATLDVQIADLEQLRGRSSDRSFQTDRQQILGFDRELHRQLLEHVRQKPLTIMFTASSVPMPRCRQ
jgi:hypothetical protein